MTAELPAATRSLIRAIDDLGIDWCVLRDPDQLQKPGGEIDILIRRVDAARLHEAVRSLGYTRLVVWGHGPRAQYVRFVPEAGSWLKLDVVWRLEFGRSRLVRTELAEVLLARRRAVAPVPTPDPNDAFWVLLLHCLLDKTVFPVRHLPTLQRLVELSDSASIAGRVVLGFAGDAEVRTVVDAIRRGDEQALEEACARWSGLAGSVHPFGGLGLLWRRLGRAGSRRFRSLRKPGVSVAAIDTEGGSCDQILAGIKALESKPALGVETMDWHRPESSEPALLDDWLRWGSVLGRRLQGTNVMLMGFGARDLRCSLRSSALRPPDPAVVLAVVKAGNEPTWLSACPNAVRIDPEMGTTLASVLATATIVSR